MAKSTDQTNETQEPTTIDVVLDPVMLHLGARAGYLDFWRRQERVHPHIREILLAGGVPFPV